MTNADIEALDWSKMHELLPAIVQDLSSGVVLMLGYMNRDALRATIESGLVTFFSRSKQRLWRKGETSGNHLALKSVAADCDGDALIVLVDPAGPTCHRGNRSCFGDQSLSGPAWLSDLSSVVAARAVDGDGASYTRKLLDSGIEKIAQKIGEEGVELSLAAVTRDNDGCAEEAADLLYHMAILLHARGLKWDDIIAVLQQRHRDRT